MSYSDYRVKHLEMIQGIVNRLSSNSFQLKGWSVTLITALFAFAASGKDPRFSYIAFFPALSFWLLDGYFLRQERLFRKLYKWVNEKKEGEVDFSMDTSCFDPSQRRSVGKVCPQWNADELYVDPWLRVCFSKTLRVFHGSLMILIVAVIVLLHMGYSLDPVHAI